VLTLLQERQPTSLGNSRVVGSKVVPDSGMVH